MNKPCHGLSAGEYGDHDSPGSCGYRSRGESQIAQCLADHGVPFLYEHPVAVIDQGKTRMWYPDFQLRGYGILIEYGGRLDDPDYASGWERKKRVYAANGLSAIMLEAQDLRADWPDPLLGRIEGVLMDRVREFRSVAGRVPSQR